MRAICWVVRYGFSAAPCSFGMERHTCGPDMLSFWTVEWVGRQKVLGRVIHFFPVKNSIGFGISSLAKLEAAVKMGWQRDPGCLIQFVNLFVFVLFIFSCFVFVVIVVFWLLNIPAACNFCCCVLVAEHTSSLQCLSQHWICLDSSVCCYTGRNCRSYLPSRLFTLY